MKKLLASAAFAALAVASGSASALDLGLAAVVGPTCVVPKAGTIPTLGLIIDGGGVVGAGGPSTLVNIPGAYCTGPAKLQMKTASGALQLNGVAGPVAPIGGGFANFVPYTATATWGGLSASIAATNVAPHTVDSATSTAAAVTYTLLVKASTTGSGFPLVPGSYSDILTVQILPN